MSCWLYGQCVINAFLFRLLNARSVSFCWEISMCSTSHPGTRTVARSVRALASLPSGQLLRQRTSNSTCPDVTDSVRGGTSCVGRHDSSRCCSRHEKLLDSSLWPLSDVWHYLPPCSSLFSVSLCPTAKPPARSAARPR